jgi:hypothetical protein
LAPVGHHASDRVETVVIHCQFSLSGKRRLPRRQDAAGAVRAALASAPPAANWSAATCVPARDRVWLNWIGSSASAARPTAASAASARAMAKTAIPLGSEGRRWPLPTSEGCQPVSLGLRPQFRAAVVGQRGHDDRVWLHGHRWFLYRRGAVFAPLLLFLASGNAQFPAEPRRAIHAAADLAAERDREVFCFVSGVVLVLRWDGDLKLVRPTGAP